MNILEYQINYNVGKAKYIISYYTGKKHKDGSKFFDIKIFKNKKDFNDFLKEMKGGLKE
jgi:hypothetical protein